MSAEPGGRGFGVWLLGFCGLAALGGLFACVVLGWTLVAARRLGLPPGVAEGFRVFLNSGGWLRIPAGCAAVAALAALPRAGRTDRRMLVLGVITALGVVIARMGPSAPELSPTRIPQRARDKTQAILRWAYKSDATVANILELSHDPDPRVREQAVMALGVNLVVTDIERSTVTRPSRHLDDPLRGQLKARLLECLASDPEESVRAEAARGLWKAPVAFGIVPAAAETLAAVLDRSAREPARPDRFAWLALDAAAGAPNPALKSAAARFARTVSDSDLARAARQAEQPSGPR